MHQNHSKFVQFEIQFTKKIIRKRRQGDNSDLSQKEKTILVYIFL